MSSIEEEHDSIKEMPPPTKDMAIDLNSVSEEEEHLHFKFFSNSQDGLTRYLKV